MVQNHLSQNASFSLKRRPIFKLAVIIFYLLLFLFGYYFGVNTQTTTSEQPESETSAAVAELSPVTELTLPSEINETSLYYQMDEKLFFLSPLNSDPDMVLDKVYSYALSSDGKRIAFIKEYGEKETNSVYVQNIADQKIEMEISSDYGANREVAWSPDGKYLLVSSGTGPEGSMSVYETESGKKTVDFGDWNLYWIDFKTVFTTQSTAVEAVRPWGGGDGKSIAVIDIYSGNENILLAADNLADYRALKADSDCLYFQKSKVNEPQEWLDQKKIVTEYYCYQLSQKTFKPVFDTQIETEESLLRKQIKEIYPEYAAIDKIFQTEKNPAHPDWIMAVIHNGGSIYNSEIIIFNIDDPLNTLKKITQGIRFTWVN